MLKLLDIYENFRVGYFGMQIELALQQDTKGKKWENL